MVLCVAAKLQLVREKKLDWDFKQQRQILPLVELTDLSHQCPEITG